MINYGVCMWTTESVSDIKMRRKTARNLRRQNVSRRNAQISLTTLTESNAVSVANCYAFLIECPRTTSAQVLFPEKHCSKTADCSIKDHNTLRFHSKSKLANLLTATKKCLDLEEPSLKLNPRRVKKGVRYAHKYFQTLLLSFHTQTQSTPSINHNRFLMLLAVKQLTQLQLSKNLTNKVRRKSATDAIKRSR